MMSDRENGIKNFVLGGGSLIVGGMLLAYMEWRIDVAVSQALSSQDLGTDAKIVSMDRNIDANRALSNRNKEEIDDADPGLEQRAVPTGHLL